uniref:Uncharacterized protein n=1 Tax=Megaviridae environmental sample TaxID=1737588 RepID=A0A5J6VL86_9VIRU|nr:MAG: hypothetical protein [Megaviridae environmental sample]
MSTFIQQQKKYMEEKTREFKHIQKIIQINKNTQPDSGDDFFVNQCRDLYELIRDLKKKNCSLIKLKNKLNKDIDCLNKKNMTLTKSSNSIKGSTTSTTQMLLDKNVLYNRHLIYKYNLVIGSIIIILMLFN